MNAPPIYYQSANQAYANNQPSFVHVNNTDLAQMFKRWLLQDAMAVYEWKMPESWNKNYVLYCLYCWGFFAVLNTDKFGIIPQGGSLSGYNVMYQPSHVMIANPLLLGSRRLAIGKDTEIVQLKDDYCGVMDLVNWYGDLLALAAETSATNLTNSKLAYIFMAKDTRAAESMKKIYDQITAGQPAVVADKSLANNASGKLDVTTFAQNLGQNFITKDILDTMRQLKDMFCTEIGIPNANKSKKERMITAEAESNAVEVYNKAMVTLQRLQEGCKRVHKLFGLTENDLWVTMRGGENDVYFGNNERTGTV